MESPLLKLFAEFDSIKNSGCHGNQIEFFKEFLKIFPETGPIFHRIVPWVTLFKNCLLNSDPSKNMAVVGDAFLHCVDLRKFFKNVLL